MTPINLIKQRFTPASASPKSSSRRRRLWEIPTACHCAIIGVCLPMDVLRRLAGRVLISPDTVDDYALHNRAVQVAIERNPFSQIIQDELDARYAAEIKQARKLRDLAALDAVWRHATQHGNVAGMLWAVLSHPLCNFALSESISHQMHMLQHQAGAAMHLDVARYHALTEENAALTRALAKAQQRCEAMVQEKCSMIDQLNAQLMRMRTEFIALDRERQNLQTELDALRTSMPSHHAQLRLSEQLEYQQNRCNQLSLENARLNKLLTRQQTATPPPRHTPPCAVPKTADTPAAPEIALQGQRILCVGGRESAVGIYREIVEQAGGHLLHHDGGIKDRLVQLDAILRATDLVICQTGCISHNAYWRVKDHCKRTGKRCAFVEAPSTTGLARGLRNLLSDSLVEEQEDSQNEKSVAVTDRQEQT